MKPTYHIVSHSHWDREWYKTFEQFRSMLIPMVDDLIELLGRDPEFRHFTLDGQTIILDDYLAVRPEREGELRKLVGEGRLQVGPWYVLPDEFLVSAESTVRNLLTGLATARRFGGGMRVGYIPDSFGHIGMMPAILQGFGIENGLVYRGFGGEPGENSSEYWWTAPDGSRVLMVHLYSNGYSAGYFHDENNEQIIARFRELSRELEGRAATRHRLLMNGGDHHWPDPKLPATLRLLRENFDGEFIHGTIPRYVDAVRAELPPLPEVKGELRFGYRYAFAVMGGVYSSRLYLKQQNWECEGLLERYVEPVNAWARALKRHSSLPLIRHAWRTLMQNHPHDSICGCSIDPVHREMLTRFRSVREIGNSILDRTFRGILGPDAASPGEARTLYLFNPSPQVRSSAAEAEIAFYRQDVVVGLNPDVRIAPKRPPVRGCTVQDYAGKSVRHQILSRKEGYDIAYTDFNYPKQTIADRFTLLIDAADVPPVGCIGLRIEPAKRMPEYPTTLRTGKGWIGNRFIRVEAQRNGTVVVRDLQNGEAYRGLNQFESTGDVGDEYNYSYPKRDRRVLSTGFRAKVSVVEKGPLRASLRVETTMRVPAGAAPDRKSRSRRSIPFRIVTFLRLTESSRFVEVVAEAANTSRDHRFRALFPAGVATNRVIVDSQFGVVERAERKFNISEFTIEHPARVAPMQRFVTVSGEKRGLTILSDGLPEYELLPGGKGTLALTLLRCVGLLAGNDLITRPGGMAGWYSETPDAQCQGNHRFRYAILPHTGEEIADHSLLNLASEEFHRPFLPVRGEGPDLVAPAESLLQPIDPRLQLSALKEAEDGGDLILRVVNTGPVEIDTIIRFNRPLAGAWHSRLSEEKLGEAGRQGEGVVIHVAARGMSTIRVEFADGGRV